MKVIKLGGAESEDMAFLKGFALSLKGCAQKTVIVHGGGKQISALQTQMGLTPRHINGLRYTDEETALIAEMCLAGQVNKRLVRELCAMGLPAIGLSGSEGFLRAQKYEDGQEDYGYVGKLISLDVELLNTLLSASIIPVIAPLAVGPHGKIYNVNADTAAAFIAMQLKADSMEFVTKVGGVLKSGSLVPMLTFTECEKSILDGTITDGMIPKIKAAQMASEGGVPHVRLCSAPSEDRGTRFIQTQDAAQ